MMMMMTKDEACSFALSIANGSSLFTVMKAIIELEVFDIINQAKPGEYLSPAEIAARLPSTNSDATTTMLDRILRLLASYSILSCSIRTLSNGRVEKLYGPCLVSEFFSKSQGFGPMLLLGQEKAVANAWYRLKDAVLDGGIAFDKAHGISTFEYLGRDVRFNKLFNNAMSTSSTIYMEKMLQTYKELEDVSVLVDVGGGTGANLNMIISRYPTIKGINYDLPHVIKNAPTYDGVKHVTGDMFVSVPKGDAIFMKWICHDWSDEDCIKLLRNCYAALPEDGKVILCEYILPLSPENNHSTKGVFNFDAAMMIFNGKERSEKEFQALAKQAGFKGFKVNCAAYDLKVMEFFKKE